MNEHLLIVDNEAPTRELLSLYFQTYGFRVSTASTGRQAMELISEADYDLVILDINLGDVNGLDLLKPIKTAHPKLPVIIFTGLGSNPTLVNKAKENGASGFIAKTQPLAEMLAEIHKAL